MDLAIPMWLGDLLAIPMWLGEDPFCIQSILFASVVLLAVAVAFYTIGIVRIDHAVSSSRESEAAEEKRKPESVNYHFTRQCNYKCGFCFHTAKTSFVLPIEEAKRGLKMLKDAGRFYSYI